MSCGAARALGAPAAVGNNPRADVRFRPVKTLILKPSSLGDVVQALPVLRHLKRHQPDQEIYWWIDSALSGLLEGDPDLSGLFLFHRRRWASPRYWPEAFAQLRELRRRRFDRVIDLQALARSALVAWFARGRLTIGLDDSREGASAFYDWRVPRPTPETHAVEWYLGVLRRLEVPSSESFQWLPARPEVAARVRERWQAAPGRWVALHPGARWPTKRWPVGHFAALVRLLAGRLPDARFVILGGAGDRALAAPIAQAEPSRCVDLTGRTTLPELVECLRLSELLVTNDTGPMHLAAALGTPVVALFGPTMPARTGPYGQLDRVIRARLPCVPCMKGRCRNSKPLECMELIRPEEVCFCVLQRWRETPVRSDVAEVDRLA